MYTAGEKLPFTQNLHQSTKPFRLVSRERSVIVSNGKVRTNSGDFHASHRGNRFESRHRIIFPHSNAPHSCVDCEVNGHWASSGTSGVTGGFFLRGNHGEEIATSNLSTLAGQRGPHDEDRRLGCEFTNLLRLGQVSDRKAIGEATQGRHH